MKTRRKFLSDLSKLVAGLFISNSLGLESLAGEKENAELLYDRKLRESIERHEGKRYWVYDDATGKRLKLGEKAKGNRTIGIGFNLERKNAKKEIEELGLDYYTIYFGRQSLTDNQISYLFNKDLKTAINDARKYLGKKFDRLPREAQRVVTEMSFNLGYSRLRGFKKLKQALLTGNYERAAEEMKNSRWYYQVGNRARELVERMRKLAK